MKERWVVIQQQQEEEEEREVVLRGRWARIIEPPALAGVAVHAMSSWELELEVTA